jgi:heavy metal translocating P-type ATPase
MNKKVIDRIILFRDPIIVFAGIILAVLCNFVFHLQSFSKPILLAVIIFGSFDLFKETLQALANKKFALDYIAISAILLGVITGNYLVASVIVLMLSGGTTLEKYGMEQAKSSLTALTSRIPNTVYFAEDGKLGQKTAIEKVKINETIYVRKGEVVPLDGILQSPAAVIDESSLTGEAYEVDKVKGDQIRSGTINVGNPLILTVIHESHNSTYSKIIQMVQNAQAEKSPLIRLADKYTIIFTIITFTLSLLAYLLSHDLQRVLAVLVIATPCPLILATPIALMGGVNAAAKRRIIMKRLASVEVLSRVTTVIFDKTGTITLGHPTLSSIDVKDKKLTIKEVLSIAEAIERNSLHPLAKAIVHRAIHERATHVHADNIDEQIGQGISGVIDSKRYFLTKSNDEQGMAISLIADKKVLAQFHFEDKIKMQSKEILRELKDLGLDIHIFTGDKKTVADELVKQLNIPIQVYAECTPEDKKEGITKLKNNYKITAMVGDGINDAPALAMADVGMVFSHEEQTAASEAADVVFLGGDFDMVMQSVLISKHTIQIATQSIVAGIGISSIGMVFAALGYIPAVVGAFLQEAIDILVIFNALRATRYHADK